MIENEFFQIQMELYRIISSLKSTVNVDFEKDFN